MIMPYSTKSTSAPAGSDAPDKVNFDRLWDAALRPAIDKAGYDPVRANEDVGALIITEMIERLAISDLVLADVSIPNGNVYYEVGIRHAAQKQGCILTSATWTKTLFDIDQMRQIRYPLPTESISDAVAAAIIEIVSTAIPIMSVGASPFYQVFPKYPEYDLGAASAFKKTVEELSQFQAQIIAARSGSQTRMPAPGAPASRPIFYRRLRFAKPSQSNFYLHCATAPIVQPLSSSSRSCRPTCRFDAREGTAGSCALEVRRP